MGADGENHIRVGKLNLVDLAGSERQSKTGAEVNKFLLVEFILLFSNRNSSRELVWKKQLKLICHCQHWAT